MHSILSKFCNFTGLTAQDLMELNRRFGYHAGIMFSNHRVFNHPFREVKISKRHPRSSNVAELREVRNEDSDTPDTSFTWPSPPTKWKPCTFLSKKGPPGQNLWKILFWSGQSELFNILHWEHISNLNLTIFAVSTGLQPFLNHVSWYFMSCKKPPTEKNHHQNSSPKLPQAEMLYFQWIGRTLGHQLMSWCVWVCEKLRKKTAKTETLGWCWRCCCCCFFACFFCMFFFHFPPVFFSSFLMTPRSTSPISKASTEQSIPYNLGVKHRVAVRTTSPPGVPWSWLPNHGCSQKSRDPKLSLCFHARTWRCKHHTGVF